MEIPELNILKGIFVIPLLVLIVDVSCFSTKNETKEVGNET